MPRPAGGVFTPLPKRLVRSSRAAAICAPLAIVGTLLGVEISNWSAATTLAEPVNASFPALLSSEMSPTPAVPPAFRRPSTVITAPDASAVAVMLPEEVLMLALLSRAFVTATLPLNEVRSMSPTLDVIDSATTSP